MLCDFALTRPWVVNKTSRGVQSKEPIWSGHEVFGAGNVRVGIRKEAILSSDGLLMPAEKDQPLPDLRNFREVRPAEGWRRHVTWMERRIIRDRPLNSARRQVTRTIRMGRQQRRYGIIARFDPAATKWRREAGMIGEPGGVETM